MHGRTRLLLLALALVLALPGRALAAPMPAGTYDVLLSGGTLDIGTGLLPALTLGAIPSFPLDVGTQPVTTPVPLTVTDAPISTSAAGTTVTGTLKTTIVSATATVNPADGSASVDAALYATLALSASGLITASGSCSFGSAQQPVTLSFTTAQGSPWDATTGKFTLADKAFSVPAPACDPTLSTLSALIASIVGSTGSGDNSATVGGTATRRPDAAPSGGDGSGGSTPPAQEPGTPDSTPAPVTAPGARCVVPKLAGKKLAAAKKALRKAGCKVGKVRSKASKKRRKGRVIGQSVKAGKKVPAGTRVALTVSRGTTKARTKKSR